MQNIYPIKHLQRLLLLFVVSMAFLPAQAQIAVTPSSAGSPITAQQLAQVLVGQGVVVTNAQLSAGYAHSQIGIFGNGNSTNIGLDSGIVLSSGFVADINNPATDFSGSVTSGNGTSNLYLESLIPAAQNTNDAVMLEFDVQVASDTLRFEYVFASEEYPNFSCSSYNDAFGFFISGPGVVGNMGATFPGIRNIALLPDGVTPVTINNVHGATPSCTASNAQYFVENYSGLTIIYNGFTTVLRAEIWGLTPCETYHLRLAIADVGDTSYDSGVFIKQGSLTSSGVIFTGTTEVSYAGFGDLLEGDPGTTTPPNLVPCVSGGFAIKRYGDISQEKTVSFAITGTATNGWDYTDAFGMPLDSIYTFAPFQDSMYISIIPYNDGMGNEPDETIIIDLKSTCTDSATGEQAILIIKDEVPLNLTTSPIVNGPVCQNTPIQLNATGAIDYIWLNSTGLNDDLIPNPVLTPTVSGQYVVIGAVLACQATDTLNIVVEPEVINAAGPDFSSCTGGTVQLQGTGGATYSWTGPNSFTSNQQNPTASFNNPGLYTVTIVTPAGCTYTDVTEIEMLAPIFTVGPDLQICENGSVNLTATITSNGTAPLMYSWSNAGSLSNPAIVNPVASPNATTTYILSVTNGANCTNTDTVTVVVNPTPIVSAGPDEAICEGQSVTLPATNSSTVPVTYSWATNNGTTLSSVTALNPVATPAANTQFILTAYNGVCASSPDTVTIFINEYPELMAMVPAQICEGTSTTLSAAIATNITTVVYSWSPAAALSNQFIANPTASPNTTTTYTVYADNFGCADSATVTVTVAPAPDLDAVDAAPVCEGGIVTITASDNSNLPGTTYTWTNAAGTVVGSTTNLTFTNATVDVTGQYTLVGMYNNCYSAPVTVMATVNPIPVVSAGPAIEICPSEAKQLQATDANNVAGVEYIWTPATGLSATNVLTPYAGPSGTQTYTLIATANGCTSTESYVTVSTKPTAVINVGADMILCPGVPFVTLTGTETSGLPGVTYEWYPSASAATPNSISTNVSPSATTTYTLQATVADCKTYDEVEVVVVPAMDLSITASPTGGQVPLTVNFTPSGNNVVSYAWDFGVEGTNADVSTNMNPTYVYAAQGQYTPMLVATDNMGCIDSVSFEFIRASVGIANIFTPNGDGVNDVFDLGVLPANTTLMIFNRWGKVVYESSNYTNNWDGGDVPDGIYFYSVSYPDSGEEFKGWVEIHK